MENDNVEEVYAVHIDTIYNSRDEQTYDIYTLEHLADIVEDIKDAILTDISASVASCEERARTSAVKGST